MRKEFLLKIKEEANHKIEHIMEMLGILPDNISLANYEIRMPCPVHDGDNPTAFCYSLKTKRWRCYTQGCHEKDSSIFGLVQMVLSNKNDKEVSFIQSAVWLAKLLNIDVNIDDNNVYDVNELAVRTLNQKVKDMRSIKSYTNDRFQSKDFIPFPLRQIRNTIIPSPYFLEKGFTEHTLKKFYVGFCDEIGKPMYLRSFAPIIDERNESVIGVTGRTYLEKCEYCGLHHKTGSGCPADNPNIKSYPKWKHYGFNKSLVIYNLNHSGRYIKNSSMAIITEGPKDVWWFDQHGIKNSVGIFGLHLSRFQIAKLIEYNVTKIVLALDNDARGIEATEKIKEKVYKYFTVTTMKDLLNPDEDIADISVDRMETNIKPFLNSIGCSYE